MRSHSIVDSNRFAVLNIEEVSEPPLNTNPMFSPSVQTVRATPAPRPQRKKQWRTFEVDIVLKTVDTGKAIHTKAMVDSGATGLFLDRTFVESTGWNTRRLPRALPVFNVDGTPNSAGPITDEVDLLMIFGEHQERATFSIQLVPNGRDTSSPYTRTFLEWYTQQSACELV